MRIDSLSKDRPRADIGIALSQAPDTLVAAASNLAHVRRPSALCNKDA